MGFGSQRTNLSRGKGSQGNCPEAKQQKGLEKTNKLPHQPYHPHSSLNVSIFQTLGASTTTTLKASLSIRNKGNYLKGGSGYFFSPEPNRAPQWPGSCPWFVGPLDIISQQFSSYFWVSRITAYGASESTGRMCQPTSFWTLHLTCYSQRSSGTSSSQRPVLKWLLFPTCSFFQQLEGRKKKGRDRL